MNIGRILAVSDIHGYGALLRHLLDYVKYVPGRDRLFLLGDYINKGPDSAGTLRFVQSLQDDGAVVLIGNNEINWLRSHSMDTWAWRGFLEQLPLWAQEGGFLFVHAGFRPGIALDEQSVQDMTHIREEFFRHYEHPGMTVIFGHTPASRLGADPGKIWVTPSKIGIDTGAGHGERLSLVNLTDGIVYSAPVGATANGPIESYSFSI